MSYGDLLIQTLTVRRLSPILTAGTPPLPVTDAWNHPETVWADLLTVSGLVQERTGTEIQGPELQGTVVSNAVVFLPWGTDVTSQDRVARDDGTEYDVLFVRDAAGRGHHIELDARRRGVAEVAS